jgi:hypothetical protein
MRCGPETGGGDSGVSALTSEPRYVGGGRVLEGGFVGVEIKRSLPRQPGRLTLGHLFAGRYPEGTADTSSGIFGWPLTF